MSDTCQSFTNIIQPKNNKGKSKHYKAHHSFLVKMLSDLDTTCIRMEA